MGLKLLSHFAAVVGVWFAADTIQHLEHLCEGGPGWALCGNQCCGAEIIYFRLRLRL